ncbi:CDP-glycerol glycerophosphotransferase family protein [Staphylococcus haemolyticus]|uniref:CDP-glycerol glycerophosphotransferase family protein n=1 Tax=Staphylococcus haemolyticus TaxID=1283 RepID=UPI00311A2668
MDNIKINNTAACIKGQFAILNFTLETVQLSIKTRLTDRETFVNINHEEIGKTKNAYTYNFSVEIYKDLIEFMKYEYKNEDIIDIYLSIKVLESSENLRIKIGNPRIMAEKLLKGEIITEFNGNIVSLTPYFTMKGCNLSFRINTYDIDSYLTYVDELKRSKCPNFLKKENQKVWVIGEKSYKAQLGIESNKKIILYTPTFRDDEINKAKKHIINLKLDLQRLKESIGNEYILILRPHIIISNALNLSESLNDFVVDGTKYPEISDLYLITDICITDYSSVMFDFANTKKPLLFFTYDLEFYKNRLRGFYFNFEKEAPGPQIKTNDGLIEAIKNIDDIQEEYREKYKAFYNRFCTFEKGIASKTIVEKFFK